MKKVLLMAAMAVAMFSVGCSKNDDPKPNDSVEINGTAYTTATIGTQTWTTANYGGTLYSYDEAKAIQLPSEWRLPTKADYEKLLTNSGATMVNDGGNQILMGNNQVSQKFMTTSGWPLRQGNNSTKFNVSPNSNTPDEASFWTSSAVDANYASFFSVLQWQEGSTIIEDSWVDYDNKSAKKAVRFVKGN